MIYASKEYIENLKVGDMVDMGDEFGYLDIFKIYETKTVLEGPNKGKVFRSFEVHTFDTKFAEIIMEGPPPRPEPRMITEGGDDNYVSLAVILICLFSAFLLGVILS